MSQQLAGISGQVSSVMSSGEGEQAVLRELAILFSSKAPSANNVLLQPQIGRFAPDLVVTDGNMTYVVEVKSNIQQLMSSGNEVFESWNQKSGDKLSNLSIKTFETLHASYAAAIGTFVRDRRSFEVERLKVLLRDAGARHDLVDAVITEESDDILEITRRVEALSSLLSSEDGKNLLAGYKRAANILSAEEKKDGRAYADPVQKEALKLDTEIALADAIMKADAAVAAKVAADDYKGAIAALATLRQPVDAFFEAVLVNDPDPAVRANRLNLLARLRDTMRLVADFSKVAG